MRAEDTEQTLLNEAYSEKAQAASVHLKAVGNPYVV